MTHNNTSPEIRLVEAPMLRAPVRQNLGPNAMHGTSVAVLMRGNVVRGRTRALTLHHPTRRFQPKEGDILDRTPPEPLLLWPGRVRVQRLNLITEGDITNSGKSPLHLAAMLGRLDMVDRFMTEYGTKIVDCRDDMNNTALHVVSATNHSSGPNIVACLAKFKADLDASNDVGWYAEELKHRPRNSVSVLHTVFDWFVVQATTALRCVRRKHTDDEGTIGRGR